MISSHHGPLLSSLGAWGSSQFGSWSRCSFGCSKKPKESQNGLPDRSVETWTNTCGFFPPLFRRHAYASNGCQQAQHPFLGCWWVAGWLGCWVAGLWAVGVLCCFCFCGLLGCCGVSSYWVVGLLVGWYAAPSIRSTHVFAFSLTHVALASTRNQLRPMVHLAFGVLRSFQ